MSLYWKVNGGLQHPENRDFENLERNT